MKQTPSQTVGPYFAYGLVPTQYGYDLPSLWGSDLADPGAQGQHITLMGRVFDGQGQTVFDALIEILQADSRGRHLSSPEEVRRAGFRGFGRAGTGTREDHRFIFRTIKPGVSADGHAPHLDVILTLRGLLNALHTRIYFEEDAALHASDPVLAQVPSERRSTLIARKDAQGIHHFDLHLQGPQETVFFDV
ncbi:MAG: protocatechuate 3,4-dioxygenase subunit alpha [Burkholderiaceae bacterium]